MQYTSTRSHLLVRSSEALLKGLAPDGGLYMPVRFPVLPDWKALIGLPFKEMAERIFACFLDDLGDLKDLISDAYEGRFDCKDVAPLKKVGSRFVLELFHGPTCAFKDVALSALPYLITNAMRQEGNNRKIMILTATSGDTGKAAMEGFKDVPGIRMTVFYPAGGVSPVQERQMTSQTGNNICVAAVKGNFDDAQTAVKEVFSRGLPEGTGTVLSSANSINIGRLVPQIVYYFKAYSDLVGGGVIKAGDPADFTVPTGNFGDILAGFFAKKLGLPIKKLICASNANNVLTDFIRTGVYDRNRPFYKTTSPSMDILVSVNLERLLYLLCGEDADMVRGWMENLKTLGTYRVSPLVLDALHTSFEAGFSDDDEASLAIRKVWEKERYLMDPHTAVAWAVAERFPDAERPNVVLSTASPFKFPAAVLDALGVKTKDDPFELMDQLSLLTGIPVPKPLKGLRNAEIRFTDIVEIDKLYDYVVNEVNGQNGRG